MRVAQLPSAPRVPPQVGSALYWVYVQVWAMYSLAIQTVLPSVTAAPNLRSGDRSGADTAPSLHTAPLPYIRPSLSSASDETFSCPNLIRLSLTKFGGPAEGPPVGVRVERRVGPQSACKCKSGAQSATP
jgi:hypothetical protein